MIVLCLPRLEPEHYLYYYSSVGIRTTKTTEVAWISYFVLTNRNMYSKLDSSSKEDNFDRY